MGRCVGPEAEVEGFLDEWMPFGVVCLEGDAPCLFLRNDVLMFERVLDSTEGQDTEDRFFGIQKGVGILGAPFPVGVEVVVHIGLDVFPGNIIGEGIGIGACEGQAFVFELIEGNAVEVCFSRWVESVVPVGIGGIGIYCVFLFAEIVDRKVDDFHLGCIGVFVV